MKAYGGVEVQLHHSSSRQQMEVDQLHTPDALLLGKSPRKKGRVGPRAGLGAMERKNVIPAGNQTMAVQPVACRYTD
jgi:hypothetical protein